MAINAVVNAQVKIYDASRTYGIPYGTLYRRIQSGETKYDLKPGTKPALGEEVEKSLVTVINDLFQRGFGLSRLEVMFFYST